MGTAIAKPRKTVEDFMRLPEGVLAELIEGEILMSPSPRTPHQEIVLNLASLLRTFVKARRLGKVFVAPLDVHLPSGDIVEPDVFFVASVNLAIVQDWVRGVPDLIIEVLSPDGVERDRIVKRDLYAQNGVPEYWIVDPVSKSVEILSLRVGRYEPSGYFTEADFLESNSLSGFSMRVGELFA